jgi:hypothetical protein
MKPKCSHCGIELPGKHSPNRICHECRKKQYVGRYTTIPDWEKLVRCVQPAAEIYEPGHDYCLNVVTADIQDGLVPADCFKF